MEQKSRCQSCGMPLGAGFFGTKTDGNATEEYCKFCFQQGAFTNPELTLNAMLDTSINHMMTELKFSREKATELANTIIPQLKRWR